MTKRNLALFLSGFLHAACLDSSTEREVTKWVSNRLRRLRELELSELSDALWGAVEAVQDECDESDQEFVHEFNRVFGPTLVSDLPGEVDDDGLKPEECQVLKALLAQVQIKKGESGKKSKKKKRKK